MAKFQHGNKAAAGVKRPNAGRPPDWLKAECQKHAPDLIAFLMSVAKGEDVEQAVGDNGEVIRVPSAVRDRIKATEILLERGFGKVTQTLEHTGGQQILVVRSSVDQK